MDQDYFDKNWHMEPHGENGVLFTAYYSHLATEELIDSDKAELAIEAAFAQTEHPLSHDNMTGIVCLSKMYDLDYHKKFTHKDWKRRAHPRDVAFYLYAKCPILRPLTVLTILSMFWACWHKQQSMGVLDTDGKLLSWLRCKSFGWTLTEKMCTAIIKYRHNLNWSDIFKIYFRNDAHPNVRISREIE